MPTSRLVRQADRAEGLLRQLEIVIFVILTLELLGTVVFGLPPISVRFGQAAWDFGSVLPCRSEVRVQT